MTGFLQFGVSSPGLKSAKTKKIHISLFELFELFAAITFRVWRDSYKVKNFSMGVSDVN